LSKEITMSTNEGTLSSWIDRPAFDPNGDEIGVIADIYVDDATGEPEWLALKADRGSGRLSFVPLAGAGTQDDGVAVAYDKDLVTSVPDADPDGTLTLDDEARLYAHYGLHYSTRRSGSGLPEQPVVEVQTVEVQAVEAEDVDRPAGPRLRRRRTDEDFDMIRLPSKDVPIVVKQRR
jgi:hypothetical protein